MKSIPLSRAIGLALGCAALIAAPWTYAEDDEADATEVEAAKDNLVLLGVQGVDSSGDKENLERHSDGFDDNVVLELLRLSGQSDRYFYALEGRDIGQKDQSLEVNGGIYEKLKVKAGWKEQFRNYTDGVSLGTFERPDFFAVPDPVQGLLQQGFLPLNANPTAQGQADLLGLLANAPTVPLQQKRQTGRLAAELALSPALSVRAGFRHDDRDGLKAVSSGSYRRASTGATSIGGLGENFRTYGLEFPMPIDYNTARINLGADYRVDRWFADFNFDYTNFDNNVDSVTFDNPLLLTSQSGVGGAPIRQMDLAPDYESVSYSVTAGVRDLPLRSRLTITYSNDTVTQDDPFLPFAANPGLLDDDGVPVIDLPLPQRDLDGKVNTELFNVVLNLRPVHPLSVNVRFNRYDYDNSSDVITWDGYAAVGESSWRDLDGSAAGQVPFRNRVPDYTRTRTGADATWNFSSMVRLSGEYQYEEFERNADRYADNQEDKYRLSLTVLPFDFATVKVSGGEARRDIDGDYAEHLANGIQEEFAELRQFDQAERNRTRYDVDVDFDVGRNLSVGMSWSRYKDNYDKDFFGLQDFKGVLAGIDASLVVGDRVTASGYYNRDKFESNQRNRGKSNATGGGAFAVPENDFDTYIKDDTDSYGGSLDATLIPERLSLELSLDISDADGRIDTTNPNFTPGITTTGSTANPFPDTHVETKQFIVALNYDWSASVTTGLRYVYLSQDITDFAADGTAPYLGGQLDAQGNNPSHVIFLDAHPFDYRANVYMATLRYRF